MKLKFNFNFVPALALGGGICLVALPAESAPDLAPNTALELATRDGGDAQRLLALLDYVAGDYGRAVQAGRVIAEAEYAEQRRFLLDARRIAEQLQPGAAADPLLARLDAVRALVDTKADAAAVSQSCREARELAVVRFGIELSPAAHPKLARAEALYARACAACHGVSGAGDGERAAELDPAPAAFNDPARRNDLSPLRVYNALTFGVAGTAMPSFEALTPAERWDLAFYALRLGHSGADARGPLPDGFSLRTLARSSDRELLRELEQRSPASAAAALAFARRDAPFVEPTLASELDRIRGQVRAAVLAHGSGRAAEADRRILDAYLLEFEALEATLRVRDFDGTQAAEAAFHELRGAMLEGTAGDVDRQAQRLDLALVRLASERSQPLLPFAAAALIYLREGIEAALIVGALLAALARLGRPEATRFVHAGWLLALPAGVATWWAMARLVSLAAHKRELVEGVVALLAAAVLFSVSFWMISKAHTRAWLGYLNKSVAQGVSRSNLLLLAGLAFLAVYREAAETVLFTQALLLEAPRQSGQVWLGAGTGVVGVAAAAFVMNKTVLRLPLGPFFAVSSVLLCALATSFAGSGIYELIAAGYLKPRPIAFPEIPWLGIHPDMTALGVQLLIVTVLSAAGVVTLRAPAAAPQARRTDERRYTPPA
jgi:high-affinity iron transporter